MASRGSITSFFKPAPREPVAGVAVAAPPADASCVPLPPATGALRKRKTTTTVEEEFDAPPQQPLTQQERVTARDAAIAEFDKIRVEQLTGDVRVTVSIV